MNILPLKLIGQYKQYIDTDNSPHLIYNYIDKIKYPRRKKIGYEAFNCVHIFDYNIVLPRNWSSMKILISTRKEQNTRERRTNYSAT